MQNNLYGLKSVLALVLLVSSACSASMVRRPGVEQSKYGPRTPQVRPGVVSYRNAGAQGITAARRENAYRQMYSACDGSYEIDSETSQADGAFARRVGNSVFIRSTSLTSIHFHCVADESENPRAF